MTLTPIEKGRSKLADGAIKVGDKVFVPVSTGAAGAVLGNQLPQNQKSTKKALKEVKKSNLSLVPVIKSDDPYFNHDMAQRAVNMVMKMDEDEARVFTSMVVGEMLEEDIAKNQRTLQRHLNHVVSKRISRVEKALLSTVSKDNSDQAKAYAQALAEIKKAMSPYDYGYRWQESDFRRDARTGRFQTKVKHTQKAPIQGRVAAGMGIPDPKPLGVKKENRAQFQDEYMQLANFLGAVTTSSANPGDTEVMLHIKNKKTGQTAVVHNNGTKVDPKAWNPNEEKLIGIEARPHSLTLGGAAFGLVNSLGADPHAGDKLARGANRVDAAMPGLATDWNNASARDGESSNARLYGRIEAGSKFVGQVAPYGSHAQIAAKFGQFVGSRGPEAEKVFGPAARKAAYRYRGVEKEPDTDLVREYATSVQDENKVRVDPDQRAKIRTARTRALNAERRRIAVETKTPIDAVKLSPQQVQAVQQKVAQDMAATASAEPEIKSWDGGRQKIVEHLLKPRKQGGRAPSDRLYQLHLDAGNTPPSEGVLINARGQIVSQAIGYGDDHYLPFNLKQMKELKGGEYIRTRSVGGPTSEDIYTGLMMGARRVTVASRSGVFTVEFNEDFRGGRRYNDKAKRMVGRYEKLLDSIQSETIDRKSVDPSIREAITHQVARDYPNFDARQRRKYVEDRIEQFKKDPDPELTQEDETAMEMQIADQTRLSRDAQQAEETRAKIINDWRNEKEYKFKLNGPGYAAALDALQEQFPYYMTVGFKPHPKRDILSTDKDKGYVEPGRNRPTEASEGWHGTSANPGGGRKSASQVDYQNISAKYGGKLTFVGVKGDRDSVGLVDERKAKEAMAGQPAAQAADERGTIKVPAKPVQVSTKYADTSTRLHDQMTTRTEFGPTTVGQYPWLKPEAKEAFGESVKSDPKVAAQFDQFMRAYGPKLVEQGTIDRDLYDEFTVAAGHFGRTPYEASKAGIVSEKPFTFTGPEFEDDADPDLVRRAARKLAQATPSVSSTKPLDEMTDGELKAEISSLIKVRDGLAAVKGETDLRVINQRLEQNFGVNTQAPGLKGLLDPDKPSKVEEHLLNAQKMRALKLNLPEGAPAERTEVSTAPALTMGEPRTRNMQEELSGRALALREAARALTTGGEREAARPFEVEAELLEEAAQRGTAGAEFQAIMDATKGMSDQAEQIIRRRLEGK